MSDLIANHAGNPLNAIRLLRTLRDADFRAKSLGTIRPGGHDGLGSHQEPRPRNDPLFHRLLQANIRVVRAFGAEIPQHRKAGVQCGLQVVHRPCRAQRQRFPEHLIIPRRLIVRV